MGHPRTHNDKEGYNYAMAVMKLVASLKLFCFCSQIVNSLLYSLDCAIFYISVTTPSTIALMHSLNLHY